MSIIAIGTVVGGKLKYYTRDENEKRNLVSTAQFVKDHEGKTLYIELHGEEEMNMSKDIPKYFDRIILPQMFAVMKDEYCLASKEEASAVLSVMFAKFKKKKADGTEYEMPLRVSEMPMIEQANFLAKVANLAVTKFGIRFPSASEINKQS